MIDLATIGGRNRQHRVVEMSRLELAGQVFDAPSIAIQRQLGMQPRRHHPHPRVSLQQQFHLAGRHGAAADHQRPSIAQVEEYRQMIHERTLADQATVDRGSHAPCVGSGSAAAL